VGCVIILRNGVLSLN